MNKHTAKHAFVTSVIALTLCFVMLLGTTFAWFTDEVTSANNIIKSGTLEITMEWLDGKSDPTAENAAWIDASEGAIFNNDLWEPGYTEVRHIKIENEGTLALKYQLSIVANGTVSELSDVIDVYYIDPAEGAIDERTDITADKKLGTLTDVLAGLSTTANGSLKAGEKIVLSLVLKMQESAGNKYQDMAIGTDFAVKLFATQYTYEEDSFDDQYDADAPEMLAVNGVEYETVEEALAAAKAGDEVLLAGLELTETLTIDKEIELILSNTSVAAESGHAVAVTANAGIVIENGVILTGAAGGDGINVAEGAALDLSGTGSLKAIGNAGVDDTVGGSGIGGEGDINIHDLAGLTAEGYGVAGFGIGGATDSITIADTTVNYAKGGYVQPGFINDQKYGKNEPEGGAAIGSMTTGAVITINDSTVVKAEGGSKAAGIGARYWTGVTVNINNSNITAFGGNASAGIGGARVRSEDANEQAVAINIVDSIINAVGGQYAAGIGSGYDTYCHVPELAAPLAINITGDSDITAKGGQYAAGVGTGYHAGLLTGTVADTVTVNAQSGDKFYKATYTQAMDIGFGVIDPARDGLNNTSSLDYKGTAITIPAV